MKYYYTHRSAMRVARKYCYRVKNQVKRTDSGSDVRRGYERLRCAFREHFPCRGV
jgi:hypothetical protein